MKRWLVYLVLALSVTAVGAVIVHEFNVDVVLADEGGGD